MVHSVAASKLALYKFILSMPYHSTARALLRFRMGEYRTCQVMPVRLQHRSLRSAGRSSYFLRDVISIMHKMNGDDYARGQIHSPTCRPVQGFKKLVSERLPRIVNAYWQEKFKSQASSANYFPALPWLMMPHLQDTQNSDPSLRSLIISHIRTHGHALGSKISAVCRPSHLPERCPSCDAVATEDVVHALLTCPYTQRLRDRFLPALRLCMDAGSGAWGQAYQSATTDRMRATLILMAPCFPTSADDRSTATVCLSRWLCALRRDHPLYHRHFRHLSQLDYYAQRSRDEASRL